MPESDDFRGRFIQANLGTRDTGKDEANIMANLIEVFSNTYLPYGVVAAVDGAARAGLRHVELSIRHENMPVSVFELV